MFNYNCELFLAVGIFIILDIISGFSQACYNKTISSTKMRKGLWHKAAYIIAIALALACEYGTSQMNLGFDVPLTIPVCTFICLTEIVSIVENIGKLNPEMANNKVFNLFAQARNRHAEDVEGIE